MKNTCHRYTDGQKKWLAKHYSEIGYKAIPAAFNKRFRLNLSDSAIQSTCGALGLQGQEDDTRYTLAEVAGMLGCSHATLKQRILKGTVQADKVLGKYLVRSEEVDRLAKFYDRSLPWPAIPSSEACKRLGYTCANLAYLVKCRSLTGIKRGKVLMLKLDEIERAEAYLKRTGFSRVPWAKLKARSERKAG